MADKVCVGAIAGAFGVKGEVRLKSFCAQPEDVETYAPLVSEDGKLTTSVQLTGSIKNGFSARLEGVKTKEQADSLRGTRLYADRSLLPELPDDEYYHTDLIGLMVLDTGGVEIGKVKAVLNHGAGDLLELHLKGRTDTTLLPFTMDCVPTVDIASGRIIADPPEGILPEDDK